MKMPTKSTFFALLSVKLLVSKCSFCGFQFEKTKTENKNPSCKEGGKNESFVLVLTLSALRRHSVRAGQSNKIRAVWFFVRWNFGNV